MKAPSDLGYGVFVALVLLGVSGMLPLFAFLSSPHFLREYYRYASPASLTRSTDPFPSTTWWHRMPALVILGAMIPNVGLRFGLITQFCQKLSAMKKLLVALFFLLGSLVLVVVVPLLHDCDSKKSFALLLTSAALSGVGQTTCITTAFGLAAQLPKKYVTAPAIGIAASGAVASALQIATKLTIGSGESQTQATVFFCFAMLVVIITTCMTFLLRTSPFSQHHIVKWKPSTDSDSASAKVIEAPQSPASSPGPASASASPTSREKAGFDDMPRLGDASLSINCAESTPLLQQVTPSSSTTSTPPTVPVADAPAPPAVVVTIEAPQTNSSPSTPAAASKNENGAWPVMKRVYVPVLANWITTAVSMTIVPGLATAVWSDPWFDVLIVATYNFGHLVGRLVAQSDKCKFGSKKLVVGLAIVRLVLLPLFIICHKPHLIHSIPLVYCFMAVTGLSHGHLSSQLVGMAPATPGLPASGKPMAGTIMSFSMPLGYLTGSILQIAFAAM